MLEYDTCLKGTSRKRRRIDISKGTDVNKTIVSEEYDICHYWCFRDIGFKYEPYVSLQ